MKRSTYQERALSPADDDILSEAMREVDALTPSAPRLMPDKLIHGWPGGTPPAVCGETGGRGSGWFHRLCVTCPLCGDIIRSRIGSAFDVDL